VKKKKLYPQKHFRSQRSLPEFDKLVVSGSRLEHYIGRISSVRPSAEAVARGVKKRKENALLRISPDSDSLRSSVARSRSKLQRLVYTNSFSYSDRNRVPIPPKFLTLTFQENILSVSDAYRYLTRFVASLNLHLSDIIEGGLKYVCVAEFQGRGAVHFHLIIFNLAFSHRIFSRIRPFWPTRFRLEALKRTPDVSRTCDYVLKYISKQSLSPLFFNKKRYSCSRGLFQPFVSRDAIFNHLAVSSLDSSPIRSYLVYLQTGYFNCNIYRIADGHRLKYSTLPPVPSKQNRGSE